MKILLMVHHDFLSVFYTHNRWLTRPQRIALLLCTVLTLMVVDAAVFTAIMLKVSSTVPLRHEDLPNIVHTSSFGLSALNSSSFPWGHAGPKNENSRNLPPRCTCWQDLNGMNLANPTVILHILTFHTFHRVRDTGENKTKR